MLTQTHYMVLNSEGQDKSDNKNKGFFIERKRIK